jgi:hypothetical protein
MTITVNNPTQNTITANALDSYVLNGIEYITSGTYTQILPNAQGCDSTITLILSLEHTGLQEGKLINISLYPNPSTDELTCVIPLNHLGEMARIYDAFGKDLGSLVFSSTSTKLNIGHLAKGTYFLQLEGPNHAPVRFVKN